MIVRSLSDIDPGRRLFIYGSGVAGLSLRRVLERRYPGRFYGFIDSQRSGAVDGRRLLSLEEYCAQVDELDLILVCSTWHEEIASALESRGIHHHANAFYLAMDYRYALTDVQRDTPWSQAQASESREFFAQTIGSSVLRSLREAPVFLYLHGPSLARSVAAIRSLRTRDVAHCGLNGAHLSEPVRRAAGVGLDFWFSMFEVDQVQWAHLPAALAAGTALVTTVPSLGARPSLLSSSVGWIEPHMDQVVSADEDVDLAMRIPGVPDVVNSLALVLFFLCRLGARGPVILLGCDGVDNPFGADDGVYYAFDPVLVAASPVAVSRYYLWKDMVSFEKYWHLVSTWLVEAGYSLPQIINANPESMYDVFPKCKPEDIGEIIGDVGPRGPRATVVEGAQPQERRLRSLLQWIGRLDDFRLAHVERVLEAMEHIPLGSASDRS